MIHLILGRQGSGKTLFLVQQAYQFYKAGKTVYSNVALKFPYKQLDYKDIIECKLEDGIVILDEVHLLLSARNSMAKNSRLIVDNFLSMVRKKNLQIYGSTQKFRKVDIRFREEADFIYDCTKFAYNGKEWIEVLHNQDLSRNIPIMIKLVAQETYIGNEVNLNFIGNPYFKLYDSREIIKVKGI